MRSSVTAAWLAVFALWVPALAGQPDPMTPSAQPSTPKAKPAPKNPPGSESPLAGPRVDKTPTGKTLVERNFDGSLVRLDERPERAAVGLLTLSSEQKEPIGRLFEERGAAVSKLLYDHFETFLAVQAARQGGAFRPGGDSKEREQLASKMRELHDAAAEAGLVRPALVEQVAKILPEDQAPEFRRLVSEYVTALEAQAQREMGGTQGAFTRPGSPTPDGARRGYGPGAERTEMNLFLREMARTLGGLVQERKERTEALFKAVDATPEQRTAIEKMLRDGAEKSRGRQPTPEQRAENFRKIMELLTPEQRGKAREQLRGG